MGSKTPSWRSECFLSPPTHVETSRGGRGWGKRWGEGGVKSLRLFFSLLYSPLLFFLCFFLRFLHLVFLQPEISLLMHFKCFFFSSTRYFHAQILYMLRSFRKICRGKETNWVGTKRRKESQRNGKKLRRKGFRNFLFFWAFSWCVGLCSLRFYAFRHAARFRILFQKHISCNSEFYQAIYYSFLRS